MIFILIFYIEELTFIIIILNNLLLNQLMVIIILILIKLEKILKPNSKMKHTYFNWKVYMIKTTILNLIDYIK